MPNLTKYGKARVPKPDEPNNAAVYMKNYADDVDALLNLPADSLADRDLRYGDAPAGTHVTIASLKSTYIKIDSTSWFRIGYDSGWVTAGFSFPNSGWGTAGQHRIRNRNGVIELRARALRVGTGQTASANGNVADETVMQIPVEFAPVGFNSSWAGATIQGVSASVAITSTGLVRLTGAAATLVISDGSVIDFSSTWLEG